MAYTSLSVTATPGKPHSFSAKAAAAGAGPHTGLFTELSVTALPGPRHSFTAKTAAGAASGPHTGLFTSLSVMGLPGGIHSFVAKTGAVIPVIPPVISSGGGGGGAGIWAEPWIFPEEYSQKDLTIKDDQDILDILQMLGPTGVLN